MKEVPFVNRRYTKGVLFCQKWYVKSQGVGPRGGASPYKTFLSPPPPVPGVPLSVGNAYFSGNKATVIERKLRKVFKQRSRFFINSVIFNRILIYRLLIYSSKIDCI